MDRATVEWVLSVLVEANYLTERKRGTGISYQLTEDGVDFLGATEQYETARFTLTGKELNALIAAVRETRGPVDRQASVSETSVAAHPPVPQPPPHSKPPADLKADVLRIFDELRRERHAYTGMVPIHELRQRVAEEIGPGAARHEALDDLVRGLQRDRRVRMVAISDLREASQNELEQSIPGMNETFFYIEAAHEPTGVR